LSGALRGSIDCDVHPNVPHLRVLSPYLDDYWREMVELRGMDGLETQSYPPWAPLSSRPDWRDDSGRAALDADQLREHALDRWEVSAAILNCLYGVQLLHDEHMAAAFARALNGWIAAEWLDPEPRLRASIVVAPQNPELAVDEIERLAPDRRFVQVLMLAMGDLPLGKRFYWPIYAAAERHGLPIGIHAGSSYRRPVTALGWPTYWAEDYANQPQAFQGQLASLVSHGVFGRFTGLKVVLIESGVTWLPAFLWRFSKGWRGLRMEVPWVDRPPPEIVREHVRLTTQPLDAPPTAAALERVVEQLGSDRMLLFASDYPHWQFEGDAPLLPEGIPSRLHRRILFDNPRETYPRLGDLP
jgi:uncharacterized protein